MALRNRLIFVILFALSFFVVTPFLASPVHAATRTTSQATKGTSEKHCVAQLSPLLVGQTSSSVKSFKCYATLSDSITAATGGHIKLSASASDLDVDQALHSQVRPNNTNVIAIFYADANYGGNSLTWYTTGASCSTGVTYGMTSMPSGWNDVISSVDGGYYGCTWYRLWANNNYGGASQCYANATSNVGSVMNDQTSSVYVRTYDPC